MSAVLTTHDRPAVARAAQASLVVVGLCAAWCGTCKEFAAAFERLAAGCAGGAFIWLDVEDDSDLAGDIDIENFPTLAVFRDGVPVHFGVSLPQEGVVARLIEALGEGSPRPLAVPAPVAALPGLLAGLAR